MRFILGGGGGATLLNLDGKQLLFWNLTSSDGILNFDDLLARSLPRYSSLEHPIALADGRRSEWGTESRDDPLPIRRFPSTATSRGDKPFARSHSDSALNKHCTQASHLDGACG